VKPETRNQKPEGERGRRCPTAVSLLVSDVSFLAFDDRRQKTDVCTFVGSVGKRCSLLVSGFWFLVLCSLLVSDFWFLVCGGKA
jgi:hypothetical protein